MMANIPILNLWKSQSALSHKSIITQLTFTCSKSTIETVEKRVKYVQS